MSIDKTPQSPLQESQNTQHDHALSDVIQTRRNFFKTIAGVIGGSAIALLSGTSIAGGRQLDDDKPHRIRALANEWPTSSESFNSPEKIMSPEEVHNMQLTQEILFRNYLSPPFMIYLRQIGAFDKVNKALEQAIRYRHELWYDQNGSIIEIKKRPGSKILNEELPDDLSIIVESGCVGQNKEFVHGKGYITKVNGQSLAPFDEKEAEKFEKIIQTYYKKLTEPLNNLIRKIQDHNEIENLKMEAGVNRDDLNPISPQEMANMLIEEIGRLGGKAGIDVKEIFFVNNILFPQQLKKLIELRNNEGSPPIDRLENPAYRHFLEQFNGQPVIYEEFSSQFMRGLPIFVHVYPDFPGKYFLFQGQELPFGVSHEGYFMSKDERSGKWEMDLNYYYTEAKSQEISKRIPPNLISALNYYVASDGTESRRSIMNRFFIAWGIHENTIQMHGIKKEEKTRISAMMNKLVSLNNSSQSGNVGQKLAEYMPILAEILSKYQNKGTRRMELNYLEANGQ